MFVLAFSATAIELQPGIRNYDITQVENIREIIITNQSGGNSTIMLIDAPSTNLSKTQNFRTNVHRTIGQPLNNAVTTNIPYRVLGTFVVSNGHYRAVYAKQALVYGLTVSNTAAVSVGWR